MRIYFVRHGHTFYNRFGIMNDDPSVDVRLTKKGKRQAAAAAEKLKETPLTHIYTSTLPRTIETAKIINKYHNLKLTSDARLNDNKTGFNGKPWFFAAAAYVLTKDRYSKRFRDGESLLDSKQRVTDFLEDLKVKHDKSDSILIVAHSNTGQILAGYFNDLTTLETFTSVIRNGKVVEYKL